MGAIGGFSVNEIPVDIVVDVDVVEYTALDTLPFMEEVEGTDGK